MAGEPKGVVDGSGSGSDFFTSGSFGKLVRLCAKISKSAEPCKLLRFAGVPKFG
jgi:hypothetical protein